jgi:hypothetical protein
MVSAEPAHLNSCQPRSFGPTQQYLPPKSRNVTLGGVHLTHQPCCSLGVPIRRGLVIEFTSNLLKPMGDPKPARNPVGATFHPRVWPRADFCQTLPVAMPTPVNYIPRDKQTHFSTRTNNRVEPPKFPEFKFKPRQVNYSSQVKPRY